MDLLDEARHQAGNVLPDEWKQMIVAGAKRHLGGIKERVEFVKPGQEVVIGITAVEAFGHTPGMPAFNCLRSPARSK